MKTHESEARSGEDSVKKLDISILKYFWQSGPFSGKKTDNVPKFLRKLSIFKEFSDLELKTLSGYLHLRQFEPSEVVFSQNDLGIGFYFIMSGLIDIVVELDENDHEKHLKKNHIITLERKDYFGELALLRQSSLRHASAICKEHCDLLGIFKPDLDEMIHIHPVVANKLLQAVSLIVANRLFSLTKEVQTLKYKVAQLEKKNTQTKVL